MAENASVRYGGEAILPYHYFRLLRERGADAWLVVHARTRDELLGLLPDAVDRMRFVEDMPLQKLFFRLSGLLPRRVSEATLGLANQLLTQWAQRAMVRELVRTEGVEVVHQPIPVSPRFPSLLWDVGVPVVIGPMNGGMEYPAAFRNAESALSRAAIAFGRTLSDGFNRAMPGKLKAAVVLVANARTRAALPKGVGGRVIEFCENGVDLTKWRAQESGPTGRFVFVGRLVDFKALPIALKALQLVPGAALDVIGGGPMEEAWKQVARELGLEERVRFLGLQSQEVCAEYVSGAVAFVLPSIYECGGAVVLEAMAMGKPVIATDWGGPADYLDAACGVLIEPVSEEALVRGFADAMERLMGDAALCAAMGAAGRAKIVREYDWQRKMDFMLSVYEGACAPRSN